jgi:hypothetical protein
VPAYFNTFINAESLRFIETHADPVSGTHKDLYRKNFRAAKPVIKDFF